MRIYYVANVSMPTEKAHGIHVAKTAEALIEAGNEVTLVIPNRRKSEMSLAEFYGLRVPVPTIEVGGFYFKKPSSIRYRLNALLFAYAYVRFFHLHVQEQTIIYTVDIDKWSCIGLPYTKKIYFSEIHGAKKSSFIQRRVFKQMQGVIATTKITANELLGTFALDPGTVCVEPNGTDPYKEKPLTQAEARVRLGLDLEKPLILYVGRVIGWKGLDILPQVAELLPDVTIGLLGATKEEYERILGISASHMAFFGSVPHTDVPLWITASDACLVMGTFRDHYSAYYSSPMKVFEYMQMERPVIASRTPVFESLFSSDTVFYFEPDNAQSLADTITTLLLDSKVKEDIARAGKVFANQHSWIKRADRITQFMNRRIS